MASADPAGVVIYVGTLSKILAPGLRIGFVYGRPVLIEHLAHRIMFMDRQGDHAPECAVAELIDERELERLRRVACGINPFGALGHCLFAAVSAAWVLFTQSQTGGPL